MPGRENTTAASKKITGKENDKISEAHKQAEADIETDPERHINPSKEDDLDEGELARLEGED